MSKSVRIGRIFAALSVATLCATTALAWPPGGNGNGNGGGGNGGGGEDPPVTLPTYTWISVAPSSSEFTAINNHGDAVGWDRDSIHALVAIRDSGGFTVVDLHDVLISEGWIDPYDGTTVTGSTQSYATGINDAGQMVGYRNEYVGDPVNPITVAFYYFPEHVNEQGQTVPADFVDITGTSSSPEAYISQNGLVTGLAYQDGALNVFLWDRMNGISLLGYPGSPREINSSGVICGGSGFAGWKYTPGIGFESVLLDDPYQSSCLGLNEADLIVGSVQSRSGTDSRPFVTANNSKGYETFRFSNFSKYSAHFLDVNNYEEMAGHGYDGNEWRPFMYSEATGLVDLLSQSPDFDYTYETFFTWAINDAGEILVHTFFNDGSGIHHESYLVVPDNSSN